MQVNLFGIPVSVDTVIAMLIGSVFTAIVMVFLLFVIWVNSDYSKKHRWYEK